MLKREPLPPTLPRGSHTSKGSQPWLHIKITWGIKNKIPRPGAHLQVF